ncbi:MAG: class I SAM-dependent methyltransferase [Nitrospira sp.]|nr:class I SAM-dependent methyltransferase [Nitrospira sp.]
MAYVDFISRLHKSTKRDYLERVCVHDKAVCAELAVKFGKDYWDGDRKCGYGGYRYDGRWRAVAEDMVKHYQLPPDARILDVGCGKGFLLYEFTQVLPNARVAGIDISNYGVRHAKEEVRPFLQVASAPALPFKDRSFDLVLSVLTIHNLYNYDLWNALEEIERVGKRAKYVAVETYRNEREKVNLLYWQLTCRAFHTPAEWEWVFMRTGYTGDHSFIVFE